MSRGFEVAKGFQDRGVALPKRSTGGSAGYDFQACERVIVPAASVTESGKVVFVPTRVATGIKAYFPKNEVLNLYNRSSNPSKRGLVLVNGTGVIDSDYYENSGNDGHIMLEFINISGEPTQIEVGDKLGQGIFEQILFVDGDDASGERMGGHGSTGG